MINAWSTDGGSLASVMLPVTNYSIWFSSSEPTARMTGSLLSITGGTPDPIYRLPWLGPSSEYTNLAIFDCKPIPPYQVNDKYRIVFQGRCLDARYDTDGKPIFYRYALRVLFINATTQSTIWTTEEVAANWTTNALRPCRLEGVYISGYFGNDDPTYTDRYCGMVANIGSYDTSRNEYYEIKPWDGNGVGINREKMREIYHVDIDPTEIEPDPEEEDPNEDDDGYSGPGGGGGDHDHDTDDVAIPSLPTISAIDTGFVSMYVAGLPAIQALASELWDNNIVSIIEHYFEHPWDYVEGLAICPVTPSWESIVYPKIGSHQLNTTLRLVSNQYVELDCGSIDINEYYGSALDFSPYEKIQLHLPYCGSHDLDIDEVMGTTIGVKYHIDVMSGACVAFVTITGRGASAGVRYQYTGDVLSHIPITSRSYDEVLKATAQLGATALATVLAPGPAAGASLSAGATKKQMLNAAHAQEMQAYNDNMNMASSAANIMGAKPQIMRGGSVSSTMGFMAVQKPFITRTIPRQSLPENYKTYEGYPSNITEYLGSLKGFTKIYSIRPNGFTCTSAELDEIISLLKGGVIL